MHLDISRTPHFTISFFHSIMLPYGQDQYAWSNPDASLYVNIIFGVNAVMAIGVFIGTNLIVKWW